MTCGVEDRGEKGINKVYVEVKEGQGKGPELGPEPGRFQRETKKGRPQNTGKTEDPEENPRAADSWPERATTVGGSKKANGAGS